MQQSHKGSKKQKKPVKWKVFKKIAQNLEEKRLPSAAGATKLSKKAEPKPSRADHQKSERLQSLCSTVLPGCSSSWCN